MILSKVYQSTAALIDLQPNLAQQLSYTWILLGPLQFYHWEQQMKSQFHFLLTSAFSVCCCSCDGLLDIVDNVKGFTIYIGGAFGLMCAQRKSEILSCLSFCGDILLKNKCLLLVDSILFFLHLVFHQLMHWLVRHFCLKFTSLLCTINIFIHNKFYIEIMVQKTFILK